MRSISIFLLVTLVVGCEHKNKQDAPKPIEGSNPWVTNAAADAAAAPTTPPPTTPPPTTPPTPDKPPAVAPPNPGNPDDVRAPTADDLAGYVKDVPGKGDKLFAKFETTMGNITCELFPDKAPMTVANFVGLATGKKPWLNPKTGNVEKQQPFFNGLTFHRVIAEFMIQGGDPQGTGMGGPGYKFGDETQNGLKMEPGTLAMANSGPATNGSQFFITEIGPDWLNGKHTIFGKCKEVDVVKKMARVPQDENNKPDKTITMKVTISKG